MNEFVDDSDDALLEGWAWTTLDAITANHDGTRIPIKADERKSRQGSYPYYGASGIIDTIDDYLFDGAFLLIGEDGANLVARSSPIAFRAHGKFWVNNHAHVLQTRGGIPLNFIEGFINSIDLQPYVTGSAQPKLTQRNLNRIRIPIPPLPEQQRIMAKVEALLEWVNQARERLARVPDILKRFRQSVLAAACSGQLTADWRGDGEVSNGLPATWQRRSLSLLCSRFEYGSSKKSEKEGDVPVLRMGNMQNGEIDWSNLKFTTDSEEIAKYSLQPNTVLFNRTNSPELVGKTAIYRGRRPAAFAGYLIRIHHGPDLNPEYLNYCLNAPEFRDYCSFVKTDGVSQSNINAKKLAAYEMPWCSVAEQQEIVRRVTALFTIADRIERRLTAATPQTERITQSVLAKAFSGDLVETEADLARREARDYEPASVLLERIAEQRQAAVNGKTKRAKKANAKPPTKSKRQEPNDRCHSTRC